MNEGQQFWSLMRGLKFRNVRDVDASGYVRNVVVS